jgi:hypothetical protein
MNSGKAFLNDKAPTPLSRDSSHGDALSVYAIRDDAPHGDNGDATRDAPRHGPRHVRRPDLNHGGRNHDRNHGGNNDARQYDHLMG